MLVGRQVREMSEDKGLFRDSLCLGGLVDAQRERDIRRHNTAILNHPKGPRKHDIGKQMVEVYLLLLFTCVKL